MTSIEGDETISKTYFREYGVHPITPLNPEEPLDYIVSYPYWQLTKEALFDHFPQEGNVITPENATTPNGPLTWTESPELIHEHIQEALDLTRDSTATLYLGTPIHVWRRGQSRWLGGVYAMQNGRIKSVTFKQRPLPAEKIVLGIEEPGFDTRRLLGGTAVLICNELFRHTKDPSNYVLKDRDPDQELKQIFAPSLWPIPHRVPADWDPDKVNTGGDEYYRELLERKVASGVFDVMKTVRRVIVSDLGRTAFPYPFTEDIAPFNAVFDRVPPEATAA